MNSLVSSPIGLGIIGSGFMARTYAHVVRQGLPEARTVGIFGGTRAPALAAEYGCSLFPSLEAMLSESMISAVLITTPQVAHFHQGIAALRAGKHIMMEKPMALNASECDGLLAEANSRGLKVGIGFTQRSRVCNQRSYELLRSGELGPIRWMRSVQMQPGGIAGLPKWQLLPENQGTLLGYGVHNIDLIRWLSGREIRRVWARCGSDDPKLEIEATSSLQLELDDGTPVEVFCSFEVPRPGFPRTAFAAWLVCERGMIDLDSYGELRVSRSGGPWETLAVQAPIDWAGRGMLDPVRLESYTAHLRDFVTHLTAGSSPSITGWDGRQAVAVVEAAYQSSRTGETTRVA